MNNKEWQAIFTEMMTAVKAIAAKHNLKVEKSSGRHSEYLLTTRFIVASTLSRKCSFAGHGSLIGLAAYLRGAWPRRRVVWQALPGPGRFSLQGRWSKSESAQELDLDSARRRRQEILLPADLCQERV